MRAFLVLAALLLALPSTAASAAKLGEPCDGIAAIQCDEGLWCAHEAGQCTVTEPAGKCVKPPEICTEEQNPVCDCDGRTYSNDCHRRMAKAQLDHAGACEK